MALPTTSKKVFTTLAFQAGATLHRSKLHELTTTEIGNLTTPVAGELAYGGDTHLKLYDGSNWQNIHRTGVALSTGSVFTSTLASNSGNAPPFVVASTDKVVNLNADLLDGATTSNTNVGDTIPVRDSDKLFHVGTATAGTHVVNKNYVDNAIQGLDHKGSAKVTTTGNINLTALTAQSNLDQSGALTADDRVLVKDQSTASENGIYVAASSGWARATDADGSDLTEGSYVFVETGDTLANSSWVLSDTSAHTWTQFSGAGQISVTSTSDANTPSATAGPLLKSGDTIDFGYNSSHFDLDSNKNLRLKQLGIATDKLQDDSVTPAKIADTYSFTMNGLTATGQVLLWYDDPVLHIGKVNVTTGNSKLQFNSKNGSAANAFSLQYIKDSTNDRLAFLGGGATEDFTVINGGKAGIGQDATSPSGTLHVSTERYGTSLVTNGSFTASNGTDPVGNITGWAAYGTATTREIQSNTFKITASLANSGAVWTTTSLVVGKKYRIRCTATGSLHALSMYSEGAGTSAGSFSTETGTAEKTVTCTSSGTFYVYFRPNPNGSGSALTTYFDNFAVQEDNLANGVHAYGDDLVVNGNGNTGISVIGQAGATSNLYFGDGIQKDFARITSTRAVDGGDANLFLQVSDGGAAAATAMTLYGGNQSAKFEGGVGIGAVADGKGLTVLHGSAGAWAGKLEHSHATNGWGLLIKAGNASTQFSLEVRDKDNASNFAVRGDGSAYFNGGNVAIGNTAANHHSWATRALTVESTASNGWAAVEILGRGTGGGAVLFGDDSVLRAGITAVSGSDINFNTNASNSGTSLTHQLTLKNDGTQDHKANSIVNSATVQGLQDGGACYDFDGSDNIIQYNEDDVFSGQTSGSISVWFKTSYSAGYQYLISSGDDSETINQLGLAIQNAASNSVLYFYSQVSGTGYSVKGSTNVADGKWHHAVVTSSGTAWKIYLDGVEETLSVLTGSNNGTWFGDVANRNGFDIGRYRKSSPTYYFNGQIRDVKIFTSALTAGDVRKLYSGENPKKNLNVDILENGDFSSATGWTEGDWQITGGKAVGTAGDGYLVQSSVLSTSKKYLYTIVIDAISNGSVYLYSGQGASNTASHSYYAGFDTVGTHTAVLDTYNTNLGLYISGSTTVTISSIKAVEIDTLVDFTSQSASSSKWYNEALLGYYDGTVNNASLSQGNSYWNNIKQDGADVEVQTTLTVGTEKQTTSKDLTIASATSPTIGLYSKYADAAARNWAITTNDAAYGDLIFKTSSARLGNPNTAILSLTGGNTKVHGKLGVGRTASEYLEVQGNIKLVGGTNHRLKIANDSNNNWAEIGNDGASGENSLEFFTGSSSTAVMSLTNGNRCGLGTITPFNELHIKESNASILINSDVDTNGSTAALYFKADSQNNDNRKKGAIYFERTDIRGVGKFVFATQSSSEADTSVALSDSRLEIDHLGTQDHKGNRIVNSQTVSDLHRTAEPSLRFDGVDDRVDVGDSNVIATGEYITVAAWVKNEGTTSGRIFQAQKQSGSTVYSLAVNNNTGSDAAGYIASLTWDGSSHDWVSHDASIDDSKWHHLAMVLTASSQKLYVDGVEVKSATNTFSNDSSADHAFIGAVNGASQFLKGEIKDVRVHNRALDSDEVKGIYNGEATPFKYADADPTNLITSTDSIDFSTGIGSWNNVTAGIVSHSTNKMQIAQTSAYSSSSDLSLFAQRTWLYWHAQATGGSTGLTVGKRYKIQFDAWGAESGTLWVNFFNQNTHKQSVAITTTQTTFVVEFDMITTTSGLRYFLFAFDKAATWYMDNVLVSEVGEVAAYTPRSINAYDGKWYDETSNANHGGITGATTVGNPRHYGTFHVKGKTTAGIVLENTTASSDIDINYANEAGDIQSRIRYDEANGKFQFYSNTGQSPRMEIEYGGAAGGAVKATSGSSTNLKQVARTTTDTIEGDGTAVAFEVNHQLGTKFLTVSVREKDNGAGQSYAYVDTEIRGGAWADANGALESVQTNTEESHITVIFSTAPANGKDYYVTCVGA